MTSSTHPAAMRTPDTGVHIVTWVLSGLGLVAAAIGLWFVSVTEGTITLVNRTYERSELSDTWGPALLAIGGAVTAVAMIIQAGRDYERNAEGWLVAVEGVLAAVGVVAFVAGIVLLF